MYKSLHIIFSIYIWQRHTKSAFYFGHFFLVYNINKFFILTLNLIVIKIGTSLAQIDKSRL